MTNLRAYERFDLSSRWEQSYVNDVFIADQVIQSIVDLFYKKTDHKVALNVEQGAFLLGRYSQLARRSYQVYIDKFLLVKSDVQSLTQFEFGQKAWSELEQQVSSEQDLQLVGWFHTHPGHGVFLSRSDVSIAENLFNRPYQIAMVIDHSEPKMDLSKCIFTMRFDGTINNTPILS